VYNSDDQPLIHISKYCNLFLLNFCIDKQVTKEQFYDDAFYSISSHLDRTSLVNEGFNCFMAFGEIFLTFFLHLLFNFVL